MTSERAPSERYAELMEQGKRRSAFFWDAIDPAWHKLFEGYVQGMYGRTVLDQKTRELCAVAGIVVSGHLAPLRRHLLSALAYGATPNEVIEVILQMSVYGGFPATLGALEVCRDLLSADPAIAASPPAGDSADAPPR